MLILLFILMGATALFFSHYYQKQNTTGVIGGPISKPKILWLAYAIFNYFIFSIWLYIRIGQYSAFKTVLVWLIGLLYCRFVVQAILMFVLRKWQPPMGMAYNVFCVFVLNIVLGQTLASSIFDKSPFLWKSDDGVILLYIIGIMLTALTDTYYAYSFFKIVGTKTIGTEAIWYASETDPVFKRINLITARLNWFFYGLTGFILYWVIT